MKILLNIIIKCLWGKKGLSIIPVFLLLLSQHNIYSQEFKFDRIRYGSGLPDIFQCCGFVQDHLGFLWFASTNSLVKFDGYTMKVYESLYKDSLAFSQFPIRSIFLDSKNNLWIVTSYGLSMYQREQDKFVNYDFLSENDRYRVFSIIQEDKNGMLWVSSHYSGLYSFDRNTNEVNIFRHDVENPNSISTDSLYSIVIDNNDNLWISTLGKGLEKFDINKKLFLHYHHSENDSSSIGSDSTGSLYKDKTGIIWIGLDNSRFDEFDPNTGKSIHHKLNLKCQFSSFYMDQTGLLWIASANVTNKIIASGIVLYDKNKCNFTLIKNDPMNLQSIPVNIMSINKDSSSVTWIGTSGNGIAKLVKEKQAFKNYKSDSRVTSIIEDNFSNIWVGTRNGLDKIELSTGKYTHFSNEKDNPNSLSDNEIRSLFYDKAGVLWIGTYDGGLNKFDIKKNKFTHYLHNTMDSNTLCDNQVSAVYEDTFDNFWIGTNNGLDKLDKKKNRFEHYKNKSGDSNSLGYKIVREIYEDRNKTIWIGSGTSIGGLTKYDRINGIFKNYFINKSIRGISDIYEDNMNRFWVTSILTGLNLFDRQTEEVKTYDKSYGLPSSYITSILSDNSGKIWLGSHYGISCFDPETETVRNFTKEDGLEVTDFWEAAYKCKNGTMYFGGNGGMVSFHPDSLQINTYIPNVVLTDFRIFNQSVMPSDKSLLKKNINIADEINLNYRDNSFSFEFAALDYNNPNRNQYAYMMEGFDNDWIKSGNVRTAYYTNLDPGEYSFRVKGSNNDGVWNEKGTSIKVIITPPWWKTWWFRGCGVILILGILGYTRQRQLSKIRKEIRQKEEFTKQLINTQEAERKRIAGELHDSLGQNLLIIKNKALSGIKNPQKTKDAIADISEISSFSLQEVREISYNLHPYQLEQLGLTKAIESIIDRASGSGSLKFQKKLDNIDNLFSPEIEINLFRMIQECINNTIKHSHALEAIVSILKKPDEISIIIGDNGRGFDVSASKAKKGLGLISLYERAKISGAKIEIQSEPDKGTLIHILFSIMKN